jgi:hypothetical protein
VREKILLALTALLLSSCGLFNDKSAHVSSPPITIPTFYLSFFSKDKEDVLLNYLASSSDWHVTSINGSLLAIKRSNNHHCKEPLMLNLPSASLDGKVNFSGGGPFFNFSPEVGISRYVEQANRVKENTTVSLKMDVRGSYGTTYEMVVENQDKSLELYQDGFAEDFQNKRIHNILVGISYELEKLAKSRSITDREIELSILPPSSVKHSKNQIVSITKQYPERFSNAHIVSGYANFGKKGLIYVKAIRKRDGSELLGDKSSTNAEYIGWSSDPNRKFGFCIGIHPEGTAIDKPSFLADIQLWFHPSDGSPEIMVHKETLRLNAREH